MELLIVIQQLLEAACAKSEEYLVKVCNVLLQQKTYIANSMLQQLYGSE